jgi:CelD/BcsL family acetyltransferase involved in cellulose biosynthesis
LRVDVVTPGELGPGEISRWLQIQQEDAHLDSPFLSPHFAIAVGRVRDATRVAVLSDAANIVGFLPFERGRMGFGGALAKGLSDVQAVVAPATADLDLGAVTRQCGLRTWEFDHLLAIQASWLERAPVGFIARERSPVIDVSDGWDAYERAQRAISSSVFQSTARKRRKLERDHGDVRLVLDEPDHARLDQLLRWKSQQYRRTGRRDRFADARIRRLVHDLLDVREPGFTAPLTVLRAGETIVAAHFGLRSRTTIAWWFPAYDPNFASYSPGLIMCIELAREMARSDIPLFDLGKGDERYKSSLANSEIPILRGSLARDRLAARIDAGRRWPRERVLTAVLGSPRLRRLARSTLNGLGALRESGARRRDGRPRAHVGRRRS